MIRVLLTKSQIDGHDRGVRYLARKLREAGMEVIFTRYRTPEEIVNSAIQEDVDVIALSILSGAHMTIFPRVLQLMRENNIADKLLTGGGIIPDQDMRKLIQMGTGRLFGPGSSTQDAIAYIREWIAAKKEA